MHQSFKIGITFIWINESILVAKRFDPVSFLVHESLVRVVMTKYGVLRNK
jgi:hypothetical protein